MPEPRPTCHRASPRRFAAVAALAAAALCSVLAAHAAAPGVVTIVDVEPGQAAQASVLRGTARLQLAEGVRLADDDLVEAGPQARLLRLEFADGVSLSVGPGSRLWIGPRLPGERGKAAPRFYLLHGWAKVEAPAGGAARSAFATPAFDAAGAIRAAVAAVSADAVQVFAEAGEVRLQPLGTPGLTLKTGELWSRSGTAKAELSPRPTPAFIQRAPRAFLDTLPSRAELFKTREVAPKPLPAPLYTELQPWLDAEPALRKAQMPRWRPLARDPEFRKGLVAGLPAHPEWERVLFPERFVAKPAPAAAKPVAAPPPPPAPKPDPYKGSPSR